MVDQGRGFRMVSLAAVKSLYSVVSHHFLCQLLHNTPEITPVYYRVMSQKKCPL